MFGPRNALARTLRVPEVKELMHTAGIVQIPQKSQWTDMNSKFVMVVASASTEFMTEHTDQIAEVATLQKNLGAQLKTALVETLAATVPTMKSSIAAVLHCHKEEFQKADFGAVSETLRKLADMNLRLLIGCDCASILASSIHNDFNAQVIDKLNVVFSQTAAMADWLMLHCRKANLFLNFTFCF